MEPILRKYSSKKREFYINHVESWKFSGLSQNKYCNQEKIPYSSFAYWKNKLVNPKKNKSTKKTNAFLPAIAASPEKKLFQMEPQTILVKISHDVQIAFPDIINPETLAKYIQAMRAVL